MNQKIPQALLFKPSRFRSETDPPEYSLLRRIFRLFKDKQKKRELPVLKNDPRDIMKGISKVQKFLISRKGTQQEVMEELILYLLEFGGLIRTDDVYNQYVLSWENFDIIIEASRTKAKLVSKTIDELQIELLRLLHIQTQETITEDSTVEAFDLNTFLEEQPQTKRLQRAVDLRTLIVNDAFDHLLELLESNPSISLIIQSLGNLGLHSARGDTDAVQQTVLNLALHLNSLALESETCDLISSNDLTEIQNRLKSLNEKLDELKDGENEAEEVIETIEFEIIEQYLQARFEITDDPKHIILLKEAVKRAQSKVAELEAYVDEIKKLKQPIETQIRELNKRLHAMHICAQPLPEKISLVIEWPDTPEIDLDQLRNWQEIKAEGKPKKKPTKVVKQPEQNTELSNEDSIIISAFKITGWKSSIRMQSALDTLGFAIENLDEKAFRLAREIPVPMLLQRGPINGHRIYDVSKQAEIDPNTYFNSTQQTKLKDLLVSMYPPKTRKKKKTTTTSNTPLPQKKITNVPLINPTQEQKILLAVYKLTGKRSTFRIATIYRKLSLFEESLIPSETLRKVTEIGKSCANDFPEYLVFMGKAHGINIYGVPKDIQIPWIDEVLNKEQISTIKSFFDE